MVVLAAILALVALALVALTLVVLVLAILALIVWWVAPICMRVESRCASTTSGGQCVTISGMNLMLVWSVNNWDIHTPEVS